ncbi:MAG: type II secretion system F family protein [Acidobacteria bacterium]|nr:type II secretion system F family protein [Acidobacteriota bacterium]
MTTFHYRAVARDGRPRNGMLTMATREAALAELRRQGLTPVDLGTSAPKGMALPAWRSVSRKDVRFFTQEMATLLSSGVPLDRALTIVTELTERDEMKVVIGEVLQAVKSGKPLADALAAQPKAFGELFVNMVRAGEAGGSLALVFERLSEYERSSDDLRGYVISAIVYPALLAVVGAASIFVLLYFVVPRFATMFEDGRMKIPLPTQIMLTLSQVTTDYGLVILAALAVVVAGIYTYIKTPAGRAQWDALQLQVPLLGDAVRKAETARFARAMSTLISNSVPLVQSLGIAARVLTNTQMAQSLDAVAQGVKRGEGLAGPLQRSRQFPPLASHLLAVGEETGQMDQMFTRMADIYDADTRAAVKRFTSLFEPLLILVMGLVVGALILSMLLAITSINEVGI